MLKVTSISICVFLCCFSIAHAVGDGDRAPSITTPRIEPRSPDLDGGRIILPAPLVKDIPSGAETFKFVLKRLDVEGAFGDLAATLPDFFHEFIGHEITVAELFEIAIKIQNSYHNAGYFLVQVFVPAQTIEDGIARIVISEAHISNFDVSAIPVRYQKKTKAIFSDLLDTKHVLREELERKLLLANNLPGLKIESTLVPGKESGATVLLLEGKHQLITGQLSSDNFASDTLRTENGLLSLSLNSPIGYGEEFIVQATFHPSLNELGREQPVKSSWQLSATLPLGNDGLSLKFSAIRSVTHPKGRLTSTELRGRLNDWSVGLSFPLVLTRHDSFSLEGEFEYIDEVLQTDLTGSRVTLTHDSLRVLRVGAMWIHRSHGQRDGQFVIGGRLSQGLDALGAREIPNGAAALSRVGGKVDFTKLDVYYINGISLSDHFTASLSAKGQFTSTPLLASQQFTLGGSDFGSGQSIGAVLGDYGFAVRGELQWLYLNTVKEHLLNAQPYLFASFGRAYLKQPTAAEQKFTTVADAGVGIRFSLYDNQDSYRSYNAYFEYARQLDGPPDNDNGHKLSFTLGVNF